MFVLTMLSSPISDSLHTTFHYYGNILISTAVLKFDIEIMHTFYLSQRIQYAKSKSDVIAKADGTFVPREKRKKHDDRGK